MPQVPLTSPSFRPVSGSVSRAGSKTYSGPQAPVGVGGVEMKQAIDNLEELFGIITYRAAEWVGGFMMDVLEHAVPQTPVDTGELRESGVAALQIGNKRFLIGKGRKDGTVKTTFRYRHLRPRKIKKWLKNNPRVGGSVSFYKITNGRDIAVWAHEDLNPFESRPNPPAARTPGTGPKYLELAWKDRKGTWMTYAKTLKNAIAQDVREHAKLQGKPTGERFALPKIRLVANKLKSLFRGGK